jgi:hypothetical protein
MKELSDRLHSIRNRNDALSRKLGVVLERQPTGEDGFVLVGRSPARIVGRVVVAIVKTEDRFITAHHHRDDVSVSSCDQNRAQGSTLSRFLGRCPQDFI